MWRPTLHGSPLQVQQDDWAKSAELEMETFATYLENVFTTNISESSIAPVTIDDVVHPIQFRMSAVIAVIPSLKSNKLPDSDRITAKKSLKYHHSVQ